MITGSKYICHFSPDDKFIDMALGDLDVMPAASRVLVFGSPRPLTYIKDCSVEFVSIKAACSMVSSDDCVGVFFHSLTADCFHVLQAMPAQKLVVWLGWGYDYYDLLLSGSYPRGRYQAETRSLLVGLYGSSYPGMSSGGEVSPALRDVINKVDYIACLDTEYKLIKRHNPWFKPQLFWPWGYGYAEDNGSAQGNDILVGNSASPENNHLDLFKLLAEKVHLVGRKVIVPLVYGDMDYRQAVIEAGEKRWGENFQPLIDFVDKDSYFKKLSTCGYVFMNHSRQQAIGNISSALLSGARVFMNPLSPLHTLLQEKGASVDLIGDTMDVTPLSVSQTLINKAVVLDTWGRDARRRQTIALALLVQRHVEQFTTEALPVAQVGKAQASAAPFFSVVMPVYNRERYVQEAIESVLQQDESDFELIVVDDGSTDRSVRIVQSIRDHRIRLLQNDHGGGAAARNAGIEAARGEFIVWIDSDDRQAPGALAALRRTIEDCHDADVYYGDLEVFDDSRPGEVWRTQYPDFYGESLISRLIQGNCLPNPGTAVRRSLYQRYGGYDVSFVRCHDFQMWTRLADSARFKKVDSIVCQWRQHDQSLSSAKTRNFEARVAQDMADRYPPSRLFPDLKGTAKAQSSALWRVSLIIQALGEPALALRAAYRAQALGGGVDQARITKLERLAGSRYEPFFTVVVTTFNRPQFLIDALDSLDKQSFRDFEVVLVNDCGEGVEHLLANFLYRINYVRQGRNQGPAAARNAAHRLARGQYLVYLDDDDIFLPDHLQVLATALQQHPGEVVYSDALFIAERVEKGVRHVLNQERRYPHGDYSRERLLVDNYIPVNTFAWPRSVALEVGGFDEDLSGLEDWDFLMRLAARLPFHHLQQETVQVRMRADESLHERRSQQALKDYPALYMELYRRHSDTGSSAVMAGRATLLQRLGVDIEVNRPLPSMQAWLQKRALTPTQKKLVDGRLQVEGVAPHFAVLIVDLQGDRAALACTLASLDSARQNYGRLQALVLTAADDIPKSTTPCEVLAVRPEEWITPLNERLAASSFDWCLLLRAGDELTPSGLMMAGLELLTAPDCRAIYCDEMFRQDEQLAAALRPAFNLDYLLSFPAGMARHWLFRREVVVAAGGFDPAFERAPELELILRLINEGGLDGLGHVAEPLLITAAPALADNEAEQQAIVLHLQQRGYSDAAVTSAKPGRYRIDYGHAQSPLVSFLILPGERLESLQRCVESVLENTRYPNYELLLIQTPLQADEVGAWLRALASLGEARIRVLPAGQEALAPQTLLNQAAEQAHGDYLLLLSADAAAISNDWLCELLNHAQRPEVGCVGAKLLAADGKIAQASLILGLEGPVGRPYVGEPLDAPGYMQRLQVAQNSGAVGHECLLLAKALFLQLGGLSEDEMPWRYAGVDLCLKARQAGYLTVWTPFSQLMLEPVDSTQGTTAEHDALYARWLSVLARDPAYNPNFSLSQPGGFKLADTALSWRPLSSWKPLPTVLAHPSDNYGSGHYRVIQPFTALQQAGLIEGGVSPGLMHVTDLERYDPDVILLQKQIGDDRFEAMRRMQAFSRALKVYELDDYLPNLPVKSVHRAQMPKDILKSMRRGLSYVDRFVVSTQALAEACGGLHGDIRVIENYLPPAWWKGLASPRSRSGKPRVGWAGGISHTGDLEMIADVVQALADEVDWVFMGMCPEKLRPFVKEIHQGVDILAYPRALAALNLDLAVAPLEENPFNQCKSNLRLLEYGACGFPVVCSDVRSYEGSLPVTRVKNRYRDWADAIRMHVADLDASARAGNDLHQQVMRDWTLEGDNLVAWRRAWLPD